MIEEVRTITKINIKKIMDDKYYTNDVKIQLSSRLEEENNHCCDYIITDFETCLKEFQSVLKMPRTKRSKRFVYFPDRH